MNFLVITPTLGDSPFLPESVAAVRALRGKVILRHVLAVPASEVERVAEIHPDCEVIADAGREGGMYGAINRGLSSVPDWDWFTYINDDDLLTPATSRVIAAHCRSENKDVIAYGDVRNMRGDGTSLGLQTVERSPRYFRALLRQGISVFTQQGALVSREVTRKLGGFNSSLRLCGDLDFWVRAIEAGCGFKYYPGEVARFRLRAGQLSGDTHRLVEEWYAIVRGIAAEPISPLQLRWARWRFRAMNAARYVQRIRAAGWVRSHDLSTAQEKGCQPAMLKP